MVLKHVQGKADEYGQADANKYGWEAKKVVSDTTPYLSPDAIIS